MDKDLLIFPLLVIGFFVYFAPAMVSSKRHHHNKNAIYVLNLLLGWTIIGWILALVWALTEVRDAQQPRELS